jgi:hypothetical protein
MALKRALVVVLGLMVGAAQIDAQAWDTPRVLTMARRATDRRVQQLADSGLVGYQATAHGYLTFLAQLGEGFVELPRVVKADELALEVYWRAPNLSKQRIIGRRDTTLLPTDIQYHRDHLGIVQNNFAAIIRLGDGDEVRDVQHPLSEQGLGSYQFALTDSLRITLPGRVIDVYEVQVRPKDDQRPGVVGAIYLDRDDARVVRMAFTFTRASFLDKQLEDLSIVLENGLVGARFWLPRRQEIEIRRSVSWLDYPVRGIIRARWEIGDYQINAASIATIPFTGPEIVTAPAARLREYAWSTPRVTDSLPVESRLPTPAEIRRVQDAARQMVREQGLRRIGLMLGAQTASDFVRFDRTSGLAVGSGLDARLGLGWTVETRARYGFDAKRFRGGLSLVWESANGGALRFRAFDDVRDAGDGAERSMLANSVAAQEFGSDFTDYFSVSGIGVVGTVPLRTARWNIGLEMEEQRALPVASTPFAGSFRPAFDADSRLVFTGSVRLAVPTTHLMRGVEWRMRAGHRTSLEGAEAGLSCISSQAPMCSTSTRVSRWDLSLELERALGSARLTHRTFAGAVTGTNFLLSQDLFFLGGPVSMPGYDYHSLIGDRALKQELESKLPIPFPRFSIGRFGRSPGTAWLAPHWSVAGIHRVGSSVDIKRGSGLTPTPDPFRATASGWYQSAGVSLIAAFDLLRLDVSRAIPTGRWLFSVDVTRSFWSIM